VVSDFRRADLAAGGQGAPLVPFADYVLFRDPTKNRVLLNLGGIANMTYVAAGASINDIFAFDIGPANCLSDHLCRKHDPTGPGYDPGGKRALSGTAHGPTVEAFATCGYVRRSYPKSTDGPEMIEAFEAAKRAAGFVGSLEDELATASVAVARSLGAALDASIPDWRKTVHELLPSGGGTENGCIMHAIRDMLAGSSVRLVEAREWTISPAAKEAVAFALLGAATLDRFPSNVPKVTGANRPVVLGSITPQP
jgi:anhydro-N-acetylmuramic acid kinase